MNTIFTTTGAPVSISHKIITTIASYILWLIAQADMASKEKHDHHCTRTVLRESL